MKPVDRRVWPWLRPGLAPLVLVGIAGVVTGAAVVAQGFVLADIADALIAKAAPQAAGTGLVVLACLLLLRAFVTLVSDRAAVAAAGRVSASLRQRLLRHLIDTPGAAGERHTLLLTRGMADVEPYFTRFLPTLALAGVLPVLAWVAILTQDWLSALVVALTVPLVPIFAALIGSTAQARSQQQWGMLKQLAGHFLDVMQGLPTLVAFRREHVQADRISHLTQRYRIAVRDTLRLGFASAVALELIATLSVALVAVVVGLRLASGSMDFQPALTVLLLAPEAYWPWRRAGAEFHAAADGAEVLSEVADVLTRPPAPPDPLPLSGSSVLAGPITLVDLSVQRGERVILDRFRASIPAVGLTVVTGESGAGKTTLLEVIRGELEPTSGVVLVGAARLASTSRDQWRSQVGWMPQHPWLLEGSIAENLRVGTPQADDAQLWSALRRVGLADEVASTPGGLSRRLGEGGWGLSAGQRARLALARVLVADRPVVVLDEPTAHLDEATEALILGVVTELARDRCVIAVSHRTAWADAATHRIEVATLAEETADLVAPDGAPPASLMPTSPGASPWRHAMTVARLAGAVSVASGVALTATSGWLIARAAEQPPILYLMVAIVSVRAFGLARPVFGYAERLVGHDAALAKLAQRRVEVYRALIPLTPGRLGRSRGELLSLLVDDVDALVDREMRVRTPLISALAVTFAAVVLAAWLEPGAGLVLLVCGGAALLGAWLIGRFAAVRRHQQLAGARAQMASLVHEIARAADHLRAWQAGERLVEQARRRSQQLTAATRSATAMTGWAQVWVMGLTAAAVAGIAGQTAGLAGPTALALLLLPVALLEAWLPVADAAVLSGSVRASAARLDEVNDLPGLSPEPERPVPLPAGLPDLELTGAGLAWDPKGPTVVAGLTESFPAGTHTAVVGPSGSGKSTLALALARLLLPSVGAITFAGVDMARLAGPDVRSRVTWLDDSPHIFASNVRENLRLARPAASDAELVGALTKVRLTSWYASLPEGLDTSVGSGGRPMSGGEQMRFGLARALLARTEVLILDEPTAQLDTISAAAVTAAIANHSATVVVMTHERAAVQAMDRVLDLGAAKVPG